MAVVVRAWTELRARRRAWAAMALLVAVSAAVVLFVAAAARRTDTAFERLLADSPLSDVSVNPSSGATRFGGLSLRRVARLPQVADSIRDDSPVFLRGRTDAGRSVSQSAFYPQASPEPRLGVSFDALPLSEGRYPDPGSVHEVTVGSGGAERLGLHPGSTLTLAFVGSRQVAAASGSFRAPHAPAGPTLRFRVVGIAKEFTPGGVDASSSLYFTPAFYERYRGRIPMLPGLGVRLRNGAADVPPFSQAVERLPGGDSASVVPTSGYIRKVTRSTRFEAAALWVLAALAGIVAVLVLAQALARQAAVEAADYPTLRALGMTPRQLLASGTLRCAVTAVAGAALAVAIAFALSPLAPFGLAREAEPDPGLAFDGLVLPLGLAATVGVVAAIGAAAAWRYARVAPLGGPGPQAQPRVRPSAIASALARMGAPITSVVGARFALERGVGPTATPLRTTFVGVILALAAMTAGLVFAASLNRLESTPRLYGQDWDVQLGDGVYGSDFGAQVLPVLRREPGVAGFATGTTEEVTLADRRVRVLGLRSVRGSVTATVIEGKAPARPGEVMLGSKTMEELGVGIGDTIVARRGGRSAPLHVVGRGVVPEFGDLELGRGGEVTLATLHRLVPEAPRNTFAVRVAPDADPGQVTAALKRDFGPLLGPSIKPQDLTDLSRVGGAPSAVVALMGALALAALGHALVVTVRRRRRDLAVLKTVGFERSQVASAVAWQALTFAAAGIALGVPIGIAAGRWAWWLVADGLGVVPASTIPALAVAILIPATAVAAVGVAALPARAAARTAPAATLAAE